MKMTQIELSKQLGMDPGQLSLMKKKGMPVTDAENAKIWLQRNRMRSKKQSPKTAPQSISMTSGASGNPLLARQRARDAEEGCYKVMTEAITRGIPIEIKTAAQAWRDAQKAVSEAERQLFDYETKSRTTVGLDEINEVFTRHLGGLRQLIDSLPASLAGKCNPADSDLARQVLEDGVAQIFVQIEKAEGAFS